MKVVGIAGSLRAKAIPCKYVETALNVIEGQGIETELISLRGKEIKPCNGCYDCVKKGTALSKEMISMLSRKDAKPKESSWAPRFT